MLHDGSVIPASRVTTNVELQQVLATLFPLLRSIRPGDLNSTLYAIATALQGRGEQLGRTMDQLDSYLAAMNQHLPTLRKDLQLLADVSNTYALAAPDLVTAAAQRDHDRAHGRGQAEGAERVPHVDDQPLPGLHPGPLDQRAGDRARGRAG